MNYTYKRKTDHLHRSFDFVLLAGDSNPWKLLAAAIIFQAAADCQNWTPEVEEPFSNSSSLNGLPYMRKAKLIQFINSDWIDLLLSWQNEIQPEAVCEELVRRLQHETV